jgi:hypothetical protein
MLGMMWEIVEADRKMFKVEEEINNEVSKILEGHRQEEWPAYNNKLDWKAKINWLAAEAAEKWYVAECTEGKIGGNRDQYRRIREAEMDATNEEDEIERTEQELLGENRNRYSKIGVLPHHSLPSLRPPVDTRLSLPLQHSLVSHVQLVGLCIYISLLRSSLAPLMNAALALRISYISLFVFGPPSSCIITSSCTGTPNNSRPFS